MRCVVIVEGLDGALEVFGPASGATADRVADRLRDVSARYTGDPDHADYAVTVVMLQGVRKAVPLDT